MESLAALIAASGVTSVDGIWQRHASARYPHTILAGRQGYGRWGTPTGFPVLYLGRPTESIIVEAYRHLIDPIDDPAILHALQPRLLVTCQLDVTEILDLTSARTRLQVHLTLDDLQSDTADRDAYARCQHVAQVAHQLGRHGILAPAATHLGETLALFTDRLPDAERPARVTDDKLWTTLPPDPRTATPTRSLRLVRDGDRA